MEDTPLASESEQLSLELWTPAMVGWITFLLGFPSGVLLACLNWQRMGLKNKARLHALLTVLGIVVLTSVILTSSTAIGFAGLIANLFVVFYLRNETASDTQLFEATGYEIKEANTSLGCLLSLLGILVFVVAVFLVSMVFALLGLPAA